MASNGKKADHEALAGAIARALAPQFVELRDQIGGLRDEVGGLRDEVGGLRDEVGGLRGEVGGLREEVRGQSVRLDRIVENTGGHYRQLEERIARLEARVFPSE